MTSESDRLHSTGQLIYERNIHTGQTVEYLYLDNSPIAFVRNGELYFIHTDHLGTPRVVTDDAQRTVWEWYSTPFGVNAANEDVDGDGTKVMLNLRFPGQYFDQETGMHYNYFRDYDPSTGRYLSSDPLGIDGGLNTYAYSNLNPVVYFDPTGGTPVHAVRGIFWIGGRIGTGINYGIQALTGASLGILLYDALNSDEAVTESESPEQCKDDESDKCKNLREKINNLRNEIFGKRIPDLANNPSDLPEYIGPGEKLRDTVRGHRKLLDRQLRRLRELEDQYALECLRK